VRISSKRWEKVKMAPVDCVTRTPRPRLAAQSISNVLGGHHADDFIAAGLAGRNGNGRSRRLQKFREEFDAGGIGPAVDGRRGQGDSQRIGEFASDGVLFCARMNFDREGDGGEAIVDRNHSLLAIAHPATGSPEPGLRRRQSPRQHKSENPVCVARSPSFCF